MKNKNQKVFVGLSGGVDSSVAAALLVKEGYDVTGVFIKTWHPDFLPCTWKEERLDAMRVAAHLKIPFKTLDAEEVYKNEVAGYMIEEYRKGRTPNPDVMCNKYVKFGAFLDFAREAGADFVATGHYARKRKVGNGEYEMLAGVDTNKDQTYFLWTLGEDALQYTLFPVGEYEKPQIRKLAQKFGLPTATKKDSQGVCFLGMLDMQDFLSHYIEMKAGNVLDERGEVIGTHDGAVFCTLGQRHGFTIFENNTNEKPYYVIAKNMSQNSLTVSHSKGIHTKNEKQVTALLEDMNWVSGRSPNEGVPYQARFRHRGKLHNVTFSRESGEVKIIFHDLDEPFALGQSLVLYEGENCIGGGVIAR